MEAATKLLEHRLLQNELLRKIWLLEDATDDKKLVMNLFFLIKILPVNSVWAIAEIQKIIITISDKRTLGFPIYIEEAISLAKHLCIIKLAVKFEIKD